jgi:hypothetical protein
MSLSITNPGGVFMHYSAAAILGVFMHYSRHGAADCFQVEVTHMMHKL